MIAAWAHRQPVVLLSYGGYYGIQLFFVLSGLLIGGLLIDLLDRTPQAERKRAFLIFMLRRWLRTLPLYYTWLIVLALVWAPIRWPSLPTRLAALAHLLPRYAVVVQNLAWPMQPPNFFDVSWSLAVEEWFYLGFALLLAALARPLGRRAFAVTLVVFLIGPVLLRLARAGAPGGSDHLVPYWLDSIAIGVAAAIAAARAPRLFRAAAYLAPAALALLAFQMFGGGLARLGLHPPLRTALDQDFVAAILALLLPAAARWRTTTLPGAGAISAIADLSYALYLVHLSVLVWVDSRRSAWHLPPLQSALLSLVLTLAIAVVLRRAIERPIMRRRPSFRPADAPRTPSRPAPAPHPSQPTQAQGGA